MVVVGKKIKEGESSKHILEVEFTVVSDRFDMEEWEKVIKDDAGFWG